MFSFQINFKSEAKPEIQKNHPPEITLEPQNTDIIKENNIDINKQDMLEFDPLKPRSDSKVICGRGDLDLFTSSNSNASQLSPSTSPRGNTSKPTSKSNSATNSPRHESAKSSPHRMKMKSPQRFRSITGESVSTMDLGGKEDYIFMAANQISQAQEHEANGRYELSFSTYKTGVGILLQGVQGKQKTLVDSIHLNVLDIFTISNLSHGLVFGEFIFLYVQCYLC